MKHIILSVLVLLVQQLAFAVEGHLTININPVWRFYLGVPKGEPSTIKYDDSQWDIVSLPHSHKLFSASIEGFVEHGRTIGWYRRNIEVPEGWLGKRLFLEFRGAMQATTLWLNGKKVGNYAVSGYDSFDFDITLFVKEGQNLIAVCVDNRVNPEIPPDGQTTDYIQYGGLYRDVFLHVTDPVHLTFPWEARKAGVRLTLPEISEQEAFVQAESTVRNDSQQTRKCVVVIEILDREGKIVKTMQQEQEIPAGADSTILQKSESIANPHLWSPDDPYLYKVVTIVREGDRELDRLETSLGLRWVKFDKKQGFFLNGKHIKLIGANYHQTWPFIGNAVPDALQRRDVEQMKAMGVNWVRLSHYPHNPAFLDSLDELGLMALEEPPTWMEPGSGKWMDNLEASFRSMIRRDRNHPCVIIWSPCINHHRGDSRLVQAAVEEDPTRDRGGDTVITTMDFRHLVVAGSGAIAIEHTGHTFPAERGSRDMTFHPGNTATNYVYHTMNREYEQAKRHLEQINSGYLNNANCGLAVWCMYDYNTLHNPDEPGLVWHGVCDLFRIPKFSYWWHQSELTPGPMAYIVRVDITNVTVFSNCERVRLWENSGQGYREVATQKPETSFSTSRGMQINYALHHPPFRFLVLSNATSLKAEGLIGDAVKSSYEWKQFGAPVALTLEADRSTITADGADLSRVVVTAVDANGTPVDNCDVPVTFSIEGLGQLVGENPARLRSGKMIVLVQSAFVSSNITISAKTKDLREAKSTIKTQTVSADVDMPKTLPAKQPTSIQ
jgi:beta-galactosidase